MEKICCRGRGHRRAEGHDQEVKGAGLGKIRLPVIGSDAEFVSSPRLVPLVSSLKMSDTALAELYLLRTGKAS